MTKEEAISDWTFRSNHIKQWLDEYGEEPSIRHYVELIDMAIEALADRPTGWIPVNERLPDVGKIVIASWSDLWGDAIVFARRYCEDNWEWAYEQGSDYWAPADRESNPEAWMPLPEPYKGGDDE